MPRGWGFGPGYGWHAWGPGRGWGRGFFGRSPWCPGWRWAYYAPWGPWPYAPDYQSEIDFLEGRANALKTELDMIQKRLEDLEKQKPKKDEE